eukprot:574608-Prymnesium_polylepis.1
MVHICTCNQEPSISLPSPAPQATDRAGPAQPTGNRCPGTSAVRARLHCPLGRLEIRTAAAAVQPVSSASQS